MTNNTAVESAASPKQITIGNTTYQVRSHFSEDARNSLEEILSNLIKRETLLQPHS